MTNFNADIAKLDSAPRADNAASGGETEMRRAAAQFESLLLAQMTSALNPKDDDEDSLFGGGSEGLNLSRQMYSEQLAKVMADTGGIGLADLMMQRFHAQNHAPNSTSAGQQQTTSGENLSGAVRRISASTATSNVKNNHAHHAIEKAHAALKSIANLETTTQIASDPVLLSEVSPEEIAAAKANDKTDSLDTRTTTDNRVNSMTPSVAPNSNAASNPTRSDVVNSDSQTNHVARVALHLPVRGVLRSGFGARRDPINGEHRFHAGVDLAAPRGTPIEAAADGKVVFAGRQRGYGNTVIIEHADGRRTRYAHAETLLVARGETVKSGQIIARVGSTGHSTGPHLHFEVIEKGHHLNPLKFLANASGFARR